MTAVYDGLQFRTPLQAQWAAFFDLAEWEWRANPVLLVTGRLISA